RPGAGPGQPLPAPVAALRPRGPGGGRTAPAPAPVPPAAAPPAVVAQVAELPRRVRQASLVPQLREAPAPRRADGDTEQPLHDPGLMAAFQRGFGLAQSSERQT
ncbi:ATP-binding protein, partial [Streptomyces sp. NPDC059525]